MAAVFSSAQSTDAVAAANASKCSCGFSKSHYSCKPRVILITSNITSEVSQMTTISGTLRIVDANQRQLTPGLIINNYWHLLLSTNICSL